MSAEVVLSVLGGLVLLVGGGEVLVRGASAMATALGMSRLLVGLTVVSFATSAPEFAVTLQSVLSGSPGLAIGNVVGSNIANILLVLGVAAMIAPLAVKSQIVKFDVPVMIAFSVLVTIFAINGVIATWQGALLVAGLLLYLVRVVSIGRKNSKQETDALEPAWTEPTEPAGPTQSTQSTESTEIAKWDGPPNPRGFGPMARNIGLVAIGVILLVLGAKVLVSGATQIAAAFGLSDMIIGLTVVAIGTSLPELATAVIATLRGETDLAIGNAVGSNIFNLGAVLGFAALITPGGIPVPESAAHFDFILMTLVAVLLLPVIYTGRVIARWEGWMFLGYYLAYTLYLILGSSEHEALKPFSLVMMIFVGPITVLIMITLVMSEVGVRRRGAKKRGPKIRDGMP